MAVFRRIHVVWRSSILRWEILAFKLVFKDLRQYCMYLTFEYLTDMFIILISIVGKQMDISEWRMNV